MVSRPSCRGTAKKKSPAFDLLGCTYSSMMKLDEGVAKRKAPEVDIWCEAPRLEPSRAPGRFLELVGMQSAKGSWSLSPGLLALAGSTDGKSLSGASPELQGEPERLATLAALFLLWTEFSDKEDEWRLIADKALAWLAKIPVEPSPPGKGVTLGEWLGAI